jgi:hypothetical protein
MQLSSLPIGCTCDSGVASASVAVGSMVTLHQLEMARVVATFQAVICCGLGKIGRPDNLKCQGR